MELIKKFNDVDPKKFKRVKCRRIGIQIEWFSSVHNRVIFAGTSQYISKKNYRSNKEFKTFKENNINNKKIYIVAIDETPEKIANVFKDDPSLFINEEFNYDPEIIIFSTNYNNFKIKKAKTFYMKSKHALFKHHNEYLLIDNFTLECYCNFQD